MNNSSRNSDKGQESHAHFSAASEISQKADFEGSTHAGRRCGGEDDNKEICAETFGNGHEAEVANVEIVDDNFILRLALDEKFCSVNCNKNASDCRADHQCPKDPGEDAPLARPKDSLKDDVTVEQQACFLQLIFQSVSMQDYTR